MYCLELSEKDREDKPEGLCSEGLREVHGSVSLVELRLESTEGGNLDAASRFLQTADLPVVVSVAEEGLSGDYVEQIRDGLVVVAGAGADYVESGLEELTRERNFLGTLERTDTELIRRIDCPEGVPMNLVERVRSAGNDGAVVKVVCHLKGMWDALEFARAAMKLSDMEKKYS